MSPSWILLELKMTMVVVTMAVIKTRTKLQTVTTDKPTPSFLQARCPSCHPSNSVKATKEKDITFRRLSHPKFTWDGLSTYVFDH